VGEPDGFGGGAKATSGFVNGYEGDGFVASTQGRWPANVIHDGSDEVLTGFPTSKDGVAGRRNASVGMFDVGSHEKWGGYNGEGSAARFFYCAKASKSERNAGLEGLPEVENRGNYGSIQDNRPHTKEGYTYKAVTQNIHPTVKPIALMRYLVKMVTPPNGVVLDPFLGSGTTAVAATLEGFQWIGCELTPDYWPIIEARTEWAEAESAKISPSQPKLF
jgi:site-specific DNA-methyltransferase (adenine-specific)